MTKTGSRPVGGLTFSAWQEDQDTTICCPDGSKAYYLERPVTAGRLSSDWQYKLLLGDGSDRSASNVLLTICREHEKQEGMTCQVIKLYGVNQQILTTLHWYGDTKKRRQGKISGTKKYFFDWQGTEFVWDSTTTWCGMDHVCSDTGSGEVACYFRSTFMPLKKDGKIEISSKITDEVSRLTMLASCIAYREWAAKRETGVYLR